MGPRLFVVPVAVLLFVFGTTNAQNVQEPAAIVVRPPAISSTLSSQPLRLTCVAYGLPVPAITWTTTDGRNLTAEAIAGGNANKVRITARNVTVNGTVFLVSVLELCTADASDSKTYRCSASNGVSGDPIAKSSAEFAVNVITEPPAIVVHPPSNHTVTTNTTVQLVCVAYGIPVPAITWSRPGCSNISSTLVGTGGINIFSESVKVQNTSFQKSILQMCNFELKDASTYTCSASNGVSGNGIAGSSFSTSVSVLLPDLIEPVSTSYRYAESSSSLPARNNPPTTRGPNPSVVVSQASALDSVAVLAAAVEGGVILLLLIILVIVVLVACIMYSKKKKIIEDQKRTIQASPFCAELTTPAFAGEADDAMVFKNCEAYGEVQLGKDSMEDNAYYTPLQADNLYERINEGAK